MEATTMICWGIYRDFEKSNALQESRGYDRTTFYLPGFSRPIALPLAVPNKGMCTASASLTWAPFCNPERIEDLYLGAYRSSARIYPHIARESWMQS